MSQSSQLRQSRLPAWKQAVAPLCSRMVSSRRCATAQWLTASTMSSNFVACFCRMSWECVPGHCFCCRAPDVWATRFSAGDDLGACVVLKDATAR